MKYEDIKKYVHDNVILAREIAKFKRQPLCFGECISHIGDIPEAENSHESEEDNAKETRNNQHP